MKRKREKGYWIKRTERFADSARAQDRAGSLRLHEHVAHVQVRHTDDGAEVSYSVAGWYLQELEKAGGKL